MFYLLDGVLKTIYFIHDSRLYYYDIKFSQLFQSKNNSIDYIVDKFHLLEGQICIKSSLVNILYKG